MKKTYTILRRQEPSPSFRTVGTKSLGRQVEDAERSVLSVQQLDEKEAAEARDDPRIQLAQGMRTGLIAPVANSGPPSDAEPGAWGLDAVQVATSELTGAGAVIAILDTGIDASHPALNKTAIIQKDFTGDGDGDQHGHGTHCAGTIFGHEIEGRRIGIAPGIRRALIGKVLDDTGGGESQMIFDGLNWAADQGAEIISMSIGFDYPATVADRKHDGLPENLAVSEALDAFGENLLMFRSIIGRFDLNAPYGTTPIVIAASGNESQRDQNPDWRVSATLPSSACHLSVAAVDRTLAVASFSNHKARIAAPGVDIVSSAAGGGYAVMSGTSMACPHVAGVAALWREWLHNRGDPITCENLKSHLLASARRGTASVLDVGKGVTMAPPP